MMRATVLSAVCALGVAGAAQAATIDLNARGLQLGAELGSSTAMSINDSASFDLGPPIGVLPGFFQALDTNSSPTLELNTGDGVTFNLALTPGFTGSTSDTAREGDRQLELIFGTETFARFILADGDSFDDVLTGATFGAASLTVWELDAVAPIPVPAGLPLLVGGLGGLMLASRRKRAA